MNEKKRILIASADRPYADKLATILDTYGYNTDNSTTADETADFLLNVPYECIILNVVDGRVNNEQLIGFLHADVQNTPLLVLDEVILESNDDTSAGVTPKEIMRRIRATIRKKHASKEFPTVIKSAKEQLSIDTESRTIYKNKKPVAMTTLEYDLLLYFIKHNKQPFSRKELLEDVWKIDTDTINDAYLRNVDTSIKNIRKKLDVSSIYAVRKIGYKWDE